MIRILIIDDQKEFRTLINVLLKISDLDVHVSEVESGEDALASIDQGKFDCVILDYMLADSTGLNVLHQIKSIQPDLPVLMISSYNQSAIERGMITVGLDASLSKDELSLEKLTQTLIKILPTNKSGLQTTTSMDKNTISFQGLEGMKILLVDDTPKNLDVLSQTLGDKGLDISIALNGKVALNLVSKHPPDLILLDIMMPIMDGFETCHELKNNDLWKNIPVIFITALTEEENLIKAFSLGAVDYITKPFRPEEVLARVNTHLRAAKLLKAKDLLINQVTNKEIQLSILMASMLDGLIVVDRNQKIRTTNPVAEKIFGYSPYEMGGKNFDCFIPDNGKGELQNYFNHNLNSKNSPPSGKSFKLEGIKKSGDKIPLELSINEINFYPEEYSSKIKFEKLFVGVVRDISQRIESEKQIAKALEAAEKANSAKSEFLAKMSHELRTPLNSILGFSQLFLLNMDHPEQSSNKDNINRIYKSGKYLLGLIDEILDLARIESGEIRISMEPVEIFSLIDEVIVFSQPIAAEHNVHLINDSLESQGMYCQADRSRLKQVLLNLVSNAIKYNIEEGTTTLSITKGVEKLRINVSDTGPGLSEEHQVAIFQPFNRLNADNSKIAGTGIGLTITKELTSLMNGTVGVESIVGKGSTFFVELDSAEKPTENVSSTFQQVGTQLSPPKDGKIHTILYVEDNPNNLRLIEQALILNKNTRLISAPQAEMGIDLAKAHDVDLILMDINLPGMDGVEAMKIMRRIEKTRNLPILALSANAMERDIQSALREGFNDYIVKPIDIAEFLEKVNKLLI